VNSNQRNRNRRGETKAGIDRRRAVQKKKMTKGKKKGSGRAGRPVNGGASDGGGQANKYGGSARIRAWQARWEWRQQAQAGKGKGQKKGRWAGGRIWRRRAGGAIKQRVGRA